MNAYYTELFVGEDRVLGWPRLTKGQHIVTFTCTGKNAASIGYNLGLDGRSCSASRSERRGVATDSVSASDPAAKLRAIGSLGAHGATQWRRCAPDGLAVGRQAGCGRVRPRDFKGGAQPVVAALTKSLGDADHVVRGLSALALRDAGGRE